MQTTITSSLIFDTDAETIISHLDQFNALFNKTKRKLYSDIIKYYQANQTTKIPNSKRNELKCFYQLKYKINARQFNSIFDELFRDIDSVLALNKFYIEDTKDKISTLSKSIKSKQKNLDSLIKKKSSSTYIENNLDKVNFSKLKFKLFYLQNRLNKNNKKLDKLLDIEKTGNPHLCFGSKKLFRQQFLINSTNNLTEFKTQEEWRKAWIDSRNKTFVLIGSKDEKLGNTNCQITNIKNNVYELKVNLYPKAEKQKEKYITFRIKIHNDKHNYLLNIIENKNLSQALTYRFYKFNGVYKIFINLDKSKQQPKIVSNKLLGAIGVDINADHLSVSEIDRFGNLNKSWDMQLNLKNKTEYQSLNNIACAIKAITDYAVKTNKPIVIEKLDFIQKKKELKSGFNKKYNLMLSSLAYSKIIQLVKSRSFDKGIEIIEVNPAYTSKIGKFKYQELYKLTTHQAASFVIARRGLLSYTKVVKLKNKDSIINNKIVTIINKEKTISIHRNKYYPFDLPVRNNQKQDNVYWKEIEQNYLKAKKHRIDLKRKKLILDKQDLLREITLVADNSEVNHDLNSNLLFQPF